jgi:hypothetical protein
MIMNDEFKLGLIEILSQYFPGGTEGKRKQ